MIKSGVLLVLALSVAACGASRGERAVTGAAIGAGVGGAGAAVADGDVATGVLIGAATGAAAGYLLDREKLDLGDLP
jgi:hypothetical protein